MGDTFICFPDKTYGTHISQSCRWWDNWVEGMCPEAENPFGAMAARDGHTEWRVHPHRYSSDATGRRLSRGPYEFVRISHPLGKAGTPPGFAVPDGVFWFIIAPYTQLLQVGPNEWRTFDWWPPDRPVGLPHYGVGPPAYANEVGDRCGWFAEYSGRSERVYQWCARSFLSYPREPLNVSVKRPRSRRITFVQTGPCMVTANHLLWGRHMPGAEGTGYFTEEGGGQMLSILNYIAVDLSAASFGPTGYPTIQAIKNAALHKVNDLVAPDMDRIDVYRSSSPIAQARGEGHYRRAWPALNDATNPSPELPGDWPLVMQLPAVLTGARREDGGKCQLLVDLIIKAASIEAWVQLLALAPTNDSGTDGELRAGIVLDVSIDLDLRLSLSNWPHLTPPGFVKKSWLGSADPGYLTEVLTTWTGAVNSKSVTPGIAGAIDGLSAWNVDGVRLQLLDAHGGTNEPLPYIPRKVRWQGELGPWSDPVWPELSQALQSGENEGKPWACALLRQLRPVMVPARKTRVQGDTAPDVYRGQVELLFAGGMSQAYFDSTECPPVGYQPLGRQLVSGRLGGGGLVRR